MTTAPLARRVFRWWLIASAIEAIVVITFAILLPPSWLPAMVRGLQSILG